MSERYGTPGELKEKLEAFEEYVEDQLDAARADLKSLETRDYGFSAGRLDAFRDVLAWWGIDDG